MPHLRKVPTDERDATREMLERGIKELGALHKSLGVK